MADQLKKLMESILSIAPRYQNVATNGIPGMGMPNMDADVIGDLRKTATQFAKAYDAPAADEATVRKLGEATEGALMTVVTIGAADEAHVNSLIDDLHQLVDNKFSRPAL